VGGVSGAFVAQTFFSSCNELTAQPVCWTVTAPLASTHLKYVFATASLPADARRSKSIDCMDETVNDSWFIVASATLSG
jgi:hypothetical protein